MDHYERKERPEAAKNLQAAIETAERKIEANLRGGLPAPRPYPHLARAGRAWIKSARYWIAYTRTEPPIVIAVFYESANIPKRF